MKKVINTITGISWTLIDDNVINLDIEEKQKRMVLLKSKKDNLCVKDYNQYLKFFKEV